MQSVVYTYVSELKSLMDFNEGLEINEAEEHLRQHTVKLASTMNRFHKDIQSVQQQLNQSLQYLQHANSMQEMTELLEKGQFAEEHIIGFAFKNPTVSQYRKVTESSSKKPELSETELRKIVDNGISQLKTVVNSDNLVLEDKQFLISFIEEIRQKNTKSEMIVAIREFEVIVPKILERIKIFDEYYSQYLSEFAVFLDEVNYRKEKKIRLSPSAKKAFLSADEVWEEIQKIKKQAKEIHENNYIQAQINDVMKQFGFTVCEDMIFSNSRGDHYLFSNPKDNNAIHIHISESKQVMMEIVEVGESTQPIMPQSPSTHIQNVNMSTDKKSKLIEQQAQFCTMHPQIVQELKKRGIIFTEKIHRKPSEQYCKQILNLSDHQTAYTLAQQQFNNQYAHHHYDDIIAARERSL